MESSNKGAEIWLNSEILLFYDPAVDAPSFYTIAQSVTEVVETRDKAEDALSLLVLIQQLASVGYARLDLEDGSVFRSDGVCRIHG